MARSVFAAGGYAGASLSQIAEKTSLRKASLYHHFSSKESLYLSAMDTLMQDLQEMFSKALMAEGGFRARLDAVATTVFEYLSDNADAAQILVREMVDGGPFVEAHGQDAIASTLTVGAQFFELGMAAGEFRQQDPRQLMISLVGLGLYSFAAVEVTTAFLNTSPLAGEGRDDRNAALKSHLMTLCCND